jgi:hypothetical protein
VPLPVTKRTDLLHPAWRFSESFLRGSSRRELKGFSGLRRPPWQRPTLALAGIPRQQNRQAIPRRRNQNYIDAEGRDPGSLAHDGSELVTFCD